MRQETGSSRAETLRGIGLLTLALVAFAVMDVLIKWLSASYGTFQIVFFRSVFGLLPLCVECAEHPVLRASLDAIDDALGDSGLRIVTLRGLGYCLERPDAVA